MLREVRYFQDPRSPSAFRLQTTAPALRQLAFQPDYGWPTWEIPRTQEHALQRTDFGF